MLLSVALSDITKKKRPSKWFQKRFNEAAAWLQKASDDHKQAEEMLAKRKE